MERDDVLFLRDRDNKVHAVMANQIEWNEPLNKALASRKVPLSPEAAHEAAGDYSIWNPSYGKPDMLEAGAKKFGEEFREISYDTDMDGTFGFDNLEELGLNDREDEITFFVADWEAEHSKIQECDYIRTDSENFIIRSSNPDIEPDWKELTADEAFVYVKALSNLDYDSISDFIDDTCCHWESSGTIYDMLFCEVGNKELVIRDGEATLSVKGKESQSLNVGKYIRNGTMELKKMSLWKQLLKGEPVCVTSKEKLQLIKTPVGYEIKESQIPKADMTNRLKTPEIEI